MANKKMLERHASDNEVHVVLITETNITLNDSEKAKIAPVTIANYSCRQPTMSKEGQEEKCSSM